MFGDWRSHCSHRCAYRRWPREAGSRGATADRHSARGTSSTTDGGSDQFGTMLARERIAVVCRMLVVGASLEESQWPPCGLRSRVGQSTVQLHDRCDAAIELTSASPVLSVHHFRYRALITGTFLRPSCSSRRFIQPLKSIRQQLGQIVRRGQFFCQRFDEIEQSLGVHIRSIKFWLRRRKPRFSAPENGFGV